MNRFTNKIKNKSQIVSLNNTEFLEKKSRLKNNEMSTFNNNKQNL